MNLFSSTALAATSSPVSAALESFIESPLGKSLIVFTFFVIIALFLRFLYGPKGIRREKSWDAINQNFNAAEEAKKNRQKERWRIEELQKELEPVMGREGAAFSEYVRAFYTGDEKNDELYRLKDKHGSAVFQNVWKLVQGEEALREPQTARAALLAALYHDIGRFEQLKKYHTFDDSISMNHAVLGAKILADKRFMAGETPATRRLVRAAIAMHNKDALPAKLDPASPLGLIARALRDADKLDIIRVMQEALRPGSKSDPSISFNLPEEPDKYSPEVAQAVIKNVPVRRGDRHVRNDFRLYICNWVAFLEFKSSLRLLGRSGHMENILSWLPQDETMDKVRAAVRARF